MTLQSSHSGTLNTRSSSMWSCIFFFFLFWYSSHLQLLQEGTWRGVTVTKSIPSSFPPPSVMGNVVCCKTGTGRRNSLCSCTIEAFQRWGSWDVWFWWTLACRSALKCCWRPAQVVSWSCRQLLNGNTHTHFLLQECLQGTLPGSLGNTQFWTEHR